MAEGISTSLPTPSTPLLGSSSLPTPVYAATMNGTQPPVISSNPLPSTSTQPASSSSPSYFPTAASPAVGSGASIRARGKARDLEADKKEPWWKVRYELENKGSVARDHLASERTYLAWLRTSLSLASIGIAITQLFRLSTVQDSPSSALYRIAATADQLPEEVQADLRTLLIQFGNRLDTLDGSGASPGKYRKLGKPVGGVFIMLALLFLILGSRRYFRVQNALMKEPQSKFPPSRRSIVASTFCVAVIVIASFAAILSR